MRPFILALLIIGLMVQVVPSAFGQQGSKFIEQPDVNVGVNATLIRAANSARIVLVCSNNDTASGIRVGGPTVSATRGMRVAPQGTFMVTATSDVWGFSEAATVVVSCTEEIQ